MKMVRSSQAPGLFAGAIDLTEPLGSAALMIRKLEAKAGHLDHPMWRGVVDPWPWYREMREAGGAHYEDSIGIWMVFSYAEVQRVLMDSEHFSSQFGNLGLHNVDPPRHRELRNLVTYAFTAKRVANLRERIQQIADRLIDGFVDSGQVDLVTQFSQPLSTTVIAELLGVPSDDHGDFRRWTEEVSQGAVAFVDGHAKASAPQQMASYFAEMIEERKRDPRNDLITALLEAQDSGAVLSDGDVFNFCVLLLVAGNETTGSLIGNAVRLLAEHPQDQADLRADEELILPAIEEVLRYSGSLQSMMRLALAGAEISGEQLEPGQPVLAWIGSANHDPSVFEDPDRFDIRRRPKRHIGFGHGIHFCLGAPLARLETEIALKRLLRRLGEFEVPTGTVFEPLSSRVFHGLRHLPLTFAAQQTEA
jgi:cytochrome P450